VPSDPFSAIVGLLIAVINAIGVITVVIAVALGLHPYVASFLRFRSPPTVAEVRAQLGRGLVLSLEIFLAADLLRSLTQPSLQDVIVLAVIAFVRIALSLSLEYEMRSLTPSEQAAESERSGD